MLWRNSLIMVDRETGTWWSHVTGEALEGDLEGESLEVVTSTQTTWGEWRRAHPDTEVLRKNDDVTESHYRSYFEDPERSGLFRSQWLEERMPGKTLIWGARLGVHAAAVTDGALAGDGIASFELAGRPLVAVFGSDGGVRVFEASIDGGSVTLRRDDSGQLVDEDTGSTWDPVTGRAVAGEMRGSGLEPVPVTRAFWFAWSSFFPNTRVID
jgi:hypothetical protein